MTGKQELPQLDGSLIREELYDLSRDPLEQQDRSAVPSQRSQQLASLRSVLREYVESTNLDYATRRSKGREAAAEISPETLEQLRALGYRQAE